MEDTGLKKQNWRLMVSINNKWDSYEVKFIVDKFRNFTLSSV